MFYKLFRVTGEANKTVFDDGLVSTVEEPKRIRAILINVERSLGNTVEGWIETTRILEIPDAVCSSNFSDVANLSYPSTNKIIRIPIEEDLKPGLTFKIALNCGANLSKLDGSYEYEPTS